MEKSEIIESLLAWNFWQKGLDTGISRGPYLEQIRRYLKTDEVVALSGIRRCGKSTILLQVLSELINNGLPKQNTLYINFEDPKFFNFLGLDLLDKIWRAYQEYLKPRGKVYLVLDEVQKVKGWEHWVRAKYDQKESVKIFVTGSNAELLSAEFSSVLTGRHLELAVAPLNFREYLGFRGVKIENNKLWMVESRDLLYGHALEYLRIGGFPKIVLTGDELLRKELLEQYFNDILTKDIRDRYKLKEAGKLKNLALFFAANFTRPYTFRKVKSLSEIPLSLDTVHRFSHYLENSFIVDFLSRFSYSLKNRMQTARKVYFVDNGLRNAVAFKFSSDTGKLLENAVFHHLKQQKKEIYYYQEKQEVDFVIKEGLKITGLINVSNNIEDKETYLRETASLKEGMRYFKRKDATLITLEGKAKTISDEGFTILTVPFYQWAIADLP
ncbi:MAG: ATP-binding protein [Candidatus Omnitrophota bacterium]